MRTFFVFLIMSICSRAIGDDGFRNVDYSSADQSKIFNALDNCCWVGDGKPNDRNIYVFTGANCQYSRQLYEKLKAYTNKVQIRWIIAYGDSANSRGLHRTVLSSMQMKDIDAIFLGKGRSTEPGKVDILEDWNAVTLFSLQDKLKKSGVPFIVYSDGTGWKYKFGLPKDFEFLDEVAPRSNSSKIIPRCILELKRVVKVTSNSGVASAGKNEVAIYAAPSRLAPQYSNLLPRKGITFNKTATLDDGSEWLAIRISNSGINAWACFADFQTVQKK